MSLNDLLAAEKELENQIDYVRNIKTHAQSEYRRHRDNLYRQYVAAGLCAAASILLAAFFIYVVFLLQTSYTFIPPIAYVVLTAVLLDSFLIAHLISHLFRLKKAKILELLVNKTAVRCEEICLYLDEMITSLNSMDDVLDSMIQAGTSMPFTNNRDISGEISECENTARSIEFISSTPIAGIIKKTYWVSNLSISLFFLIYYSMVLIDSSTLLSIIFTLLYLLPNAFIFLVAFIIYIRKRVEIHIFANILTLMCLFALAYFANHVVTFIMLR